jgi:alkylation response protein AidB-like acyl-CoA dehydrogenase
VDLRLSDEQEQLVDSVRRLLARSASPQAVREAEPMGFDAALWDELTGIGIVPMGVPVDAGGWGGTLLDLALVAEELGRAAAPAPAVEAAVAARLLARLPGSAAADALGDAVEGRRVLTLALRPVRNGRADLVPAGAVADAALMLHGSDVVLVDLEGRRSPVRNVGSLPLADVDDIGAATVVASGDDALVAFDSAIDDWLTLTAAALVGVAARAVEIGVAYATERMAWGRPIGSFQAISHPFADSATAVDGGRLLVQKAAWAEGATPARRAELAAMAFAFAAETARDATYHSLHAHGGYGFMLEYDIQLYFRRARAWAAVYGEPAAAYARAGAKRYATAG